MEEFISEIGEYIDLNSGLGVAYLIVSFLVLAMAIVASVMKLIVWIRYSRANKTPISVQMSGLDAARYVLDKEGLEYINVRKAGFLREAVFGNYYNIMTKTIYLRSVFGKIDNKQSVTSVALGVQKAAIAKLCESGDRQAVTRNRWHLIGLFGPFLFIPLVLLGTILDFMVLNTGGILSAICLGVSGIFVVMGFVVTFLNIPVEKKANEMALQMMEDHGLATGEELETMRNVYKAYITSYICDFILELLRMIQWVLEILMKLKGNKSK